MLKIKKGLANILENNGEPEEAPQPPQPQTPQSIRTALKLNEQEEAPQAPQLPRSVEPAVQAPQPPPRPAEDWGELLIRLLATAPEDVGVQLINCLNKDILIKALEKRNDPYLKVALLLLTKK
jgi:hypothetical protein